MTLFSQTLDFSSFISFSRLFSSQSKIYTTTHLLSSLTLRVRIFTCRIVIAIRRVTQAAGHYQLESPVLVCSGLYFTLQTHCALFTNTQFIYNKECACVGDGCADTTNQPCIVQHQLHTFDIVLCNAP